MELSHIVVFIGFGLIYLLVLPARWREWTLLIGSILAIYWLQPTLNIRWLDYSLPSATLFITIACWFITRKPSDNTTGLEQNNWITVVVTITVMILLTLARYIDLPVALTSRPPETWQVGLCAVGFIALLFAIRKQVANATVLNIVIIGLVGLFVVLKCEVLGRGLSSILRGQTGQDQSLASAVDIQWLGFSYVVFRLIHTLRDRQSGLLPTLSLREYITYVIFFPAYAAGPIDRAERFLSDLQRLPDFKGQDANRLTVGLTRIGIGLFKKFIVADGLAYFSLNATNFAQVTSSGSTWIMLYSYAIRLYCDFSGYSDIAIGIGLLFGIQLPENFALPYLKNNITTFWQSWHMSLSNWVRAYVYSPLSRNLLRRKNKPSNNMIILVCTVATMLVIGLWHGITVPFAIWGLWHGIGLFIHELWSDKTRAWYRSLKQTPLRQQVWQVVGVLATFHFVVLGWVWFVMPDVSSALRVYASLFGIMR